MKEVNSNIYRHSGKHSKTIYIIMAVICMLVIPQLIMNAEDGNLLVRLVMMFIIGAFFYVCYRLYHWINNKK